MAVTLGFVVVFFAGAAIAYFAGMHAARRSTSPGPTHSPASRSEKQSLTEAELADDALVAATETSDELSGCELPLALSCEQETKKTSTGTETRKFKRLAFTGTALATIYPHQEQQPGTEPMHCEVLTRDLSCGGIGIGLTQPLLPQQMIILDAVGKLLVSEVRWCRRESKDLYVAGCRLIKITT
jgi:hypothetical protein